MPGMSPSQAGPKCPRQPRDSGREPPIALVGISPPGHSVPLDPNRSRWPRPSRDPSALPARGVSARSGQRPSAPAPPSVVACLLDPDPARHRGGTSLLAIGRSGGWRAVVARRSCLIGRLMAYARRRTDEPAPRCVAIELTYSPQHKLPAGLPPGLAGSSLRRWLLFD
jgi:hypothetical protein